MAKCQDPANGLTPVRIVEIDATNGPIFGANTKRAHEDSFLGPKEIVLTFDDGPMPWITKSILATLDDYCTKATFFAVGKMALAYPNTVKDVTTRGHTVASHTMTHPFNMPRLSPEIAQREIERGFAAVTAAADQPIAPFFRFTGLADSDALMVYLRSRHVAAFSVDVVSNDSYIHDPGRLVDYTLREVERQNGGIILFHDIKPATAKALPTILKVLKARGYSVVHIVSKSAMLPQPDVLLEMTSALAKSKSKTASQTLMPFYGTTGPVAGSAATIGPVRLPPPTFTSPTPQAANLSNTSQPPTIQQKTNVPVTTVAPLARVRTIEISPSRPAVEKRLARQRSTIKAPWAKFRRQVRPRIRSDHALRSTLN